MIFENDSYDFFCTHYARLYKLIRYLKIYFLIYMDAIE
ncbi:MAG: hypothetical protein PARBA_00440 [Parabacteroides sp.]